MKSTNVCIWKLERTLEEIIPLLREDYSKQIFNLMNCDIPDEEKVLNCKWLANDPRGYVIQESRINDSGIRFIKAAAQIETNSIPVGSMILPDGTPLPKEFRVDSNMSLVLFVEYMGATYSIVCGPKGMEGKIRSNLMETSKKRDSRWGSVAAKGIPEFSFDKSFYYWILTNKNHLLELNGNNIFLEDVKGFKSDADRREGSYSGEGSNIDNEIPLKSIVSMDEKLISLKLDIRHNNRVNYSFYLDFDGRLGVSRGACGEFAVQNPMPLELEEIFINLYFDIIPFFISKFNEANQNGWQNDEINFKRKLSIDIIIELMRQNNVVLTDLETAIARPEDVQVNETAV